MWRAPHYHTYFVCSGVLEKHGADVCNVFLDTLPMYVDRPSQQLVNSALQEALKSPLFLKLFAGTIVKHSPAATCPQVGLLQHLHGLHLNNSAARLV